MMIMFNMVLTEPVESGLGPDAEASEMTTGSQLQKVKLVHIQHLNAGNVAEGAGQTLEKEMWCLEQEGNSKH